MRGYCKSKWLALKVVCNETDFAMETSESECIIYQKPDRT